MRINAGVYKFRKLLVPKTGLRPTTDKVRQALFNIIGPINGAAFLDLYSGTGAVGIEAVSRGAEKVVFVEIDKSNFIIIEKNLKIINSDSKLFNSSVLDYINNNQHDKFDFVFLDPPYFSEDEKIKLEKSKISKILSSNGILIFELSSGERIPDFSGLELIKQKKYGKTLLAIYSLRRYNE